MELAFRSDTRCYIPTIKTLYSQLRSGEKLPRRGCALHKIGKVGLPLRLNYAIWGGGGSEVESTSFLHEIEANQRQPDRLNPE
jgi:hypothetical protein